MKKTLSTKKEIAKTLVTLNILFALLLSCFPVQEVKAQNYPTVYWSPLSLNITLQQGNTQTANGSIFNPPSPPQGDTQSKIVSFYSTTALNNATLVVDPNIAPFLYSAYPQPGSLAAWQQKNVFLFFRTPAGAKVGTYEGTVQIRNGNNLLSGKLKVVINVVQSNLFTLYNNATDPLLLKARTNDGDSIEYFGERDSSGNAKSLTSIRLKTVNNEVTTYSFDELGRPTQIEAFNGTIFKIKYFTNTRIFLDVVAPDGTIQISAPIDLNSIDASQPVPNFDFDDQFIKTLATPKKRSSVVDQADDLCIGDLLSNKRGNNTTSKPENSNSATQSNNTVTVNVTECGVPDNTASVEMMIEGNSFIPDSIPLVNIGGGKYQASLPTENSAVDDFEKQCEALAMVLQRACEASPIIRKICLALAVISATLPPTAALAPIFVACNNILASFEKFCRVFSNPTQIPVPSPLPTAAAILSVICNAGTAIINRFLNAPINLQAVAKKNGEEKRSFREFNLDPKGPFPELSINFEKPDPEVKLVTTTPSVPDASQGYVVNVDINCIDVDDNLTVSYEGNDGSKGETTCLLVDSGTCFLTVPGGRKSSQDIITVKNNGIIIKTIVFNFTQIGSIEVRDNGSAADDSFQVSLDGRVIGQTSIGGANEFSIKNLTSGLHTLTVTCLVAPDDVGTLGVSLRNGLTFSGGGTSRSTVLTQGGSVTYTIIVP